MMEKEKCYKRDQEGGGGKIVGRSEKGGVLGNEIYKMRRGHAREALSWEKDAGKSTFPGKSPNLMELEQLGDVYGS